MGRWEQLVKPTANEVIRNELIKGNTAVEWWNKEVKEAIKVRREAHARSASSKRLGRMGGVCQG